MNLFSNLFSKFSIRLKIVLIMTLVSGLSSFIGITSVFVVNYNEFKENILNHAQFTAKIIASYSVPDLLFKDQNAAKETLFKLKEIPNLEIAFLFDKDNKLFSEFEPQKNKRSVFDALKNNLFSKETAILSDFKYDSIGVFPTNAYVFKHILDNNNNKIGSLYLQFDTDDFFWKIVSDSIIFLVILIITFLISVILSLLFQNIISNPILRLSSFVTHIAKTKDFSQSIKSDFNDEIGVLYQGTNILLSEIEDSQQKIKVAKKNAEDANHAKSKFLATISHELRTPLNSLLLLAKDLMKNKRGHLDEDELESATIIHKSGNELLKLINSLLYLAKIEANKEIVLTDSVVLDPFITTLENIFIPFAKEKNIVFTIEKPKTTVSIVTDEDKLKTILSNLLSNAFKFTKKGQVKLSAHIHLDENTIHFIVADTGIGIPKNKHKTVFDEFSQAHQKISSHYPGTGLGLAITKKLVTVLGGTLHFESTEGKGSLFQVTVPLNAKIKG